MTSDGLVLKTGMMGSLREGERIPRAYDLPDKEGREFLPVAYRLPTNASKGLLAPLPPRNVFIEVTNKCNLLCEHCPRTFYTYEQPKSLSLPEFYRIVDQFPNMERAVLHGIGEPLLNKHLDTMIAYLKARNVHVLFNSNGTILTKAWQEKLIASGLDEYRVSVDGANPETYYKIRGKPLFGKIIQNLRSFVEMEKQAGKGPRISLWCVAMKENIHEMPELIRLAAEIGLPEVYVQRFVYFTDPTSQIGISRPEQALYNSWGEDEEAILAECDRLAQEYGLRFQASGATHPLQSLTSARPADENPWMDCMRPWASAYVTANGNCLPCCIAPFATTNYNSLILGNLFQQNFDEIWNAERYRDFRRAFLSSDPHEACRSCGQFWSL